MNIEEHAHFTVRTGDGTKCDATPAVAQLESAYSTEATQGPLICDIKYPQIAPGFVYDPTGSIQKNAFKNGKQVTALPHFGVKQRHGNPSHRTLIVLCRHKFPLGKRLL